MERRQSKRRFGACPDAGAKRGKAGVKRLHWLFDKHHPFRQNQSGLKLLTQEAQHRIPGAGLQRDELVWTIRTVADQIGACVSRRFRLNLRHMSGNAVNCRINQAGQRHGGRIYHLDLLRPFSDQPLRQRGRWR